MIRGLDESEIEQRREAFGYNELSRFAPTQTHTMSLRLILTSSCTDLFPMRTSLHSPSENQILKFISYFRGPILYVMEIAVILSAGLRDWIDFGKHAITD